MEVAVAVGEALFNAVFEALLDKFSASDLLFFARKEKKIYNELKKWEKILRNIHAVLADAEEKQVTNKSVKLWLNELRDLAYDAEYLLDEFAYEALRHKLTAAQSHSHSSCASKVKKLLTTSLKPGSDSFRVRMRSKIKEIGDRMQEIATHRKNLDLGGNVEGIRAYKAARDHQIRLLQPTTSVVTEVNVHGRRSDKEAILKLLLLEKTADDVPVCVIPITGMGGIGKTTLAQLVYNDVKVADFFDLKAWIYVSEDFDVIKVTKAILLQAKGDCDHINDLDLLHQKLKEKLSGKKFLLVLDHFWHQNYHDWRLLISPFEVGNSETKIIITTRNLDVSQITGTVPSAYPLKELADDDCLSVLSCHALGSKNFDRHPHLREIGREIVKKCKGLPLAVITLAGLLRYKVAYKEWEAVSRSKIRDLITEEKGCLFPALRLSYHDLPSHLKPCFAYCSLIPKGYEFDTDDLVLLWIAEGFVQPKDNMTQLEDLGRKYFSELLSRSFFQQSSSNKSKFVMHDLLIDLAQTVAGDVCFNMEHELRNIDDGAGGVQHSPEKACHVSFISHPYDVSQRFEIFKQMKRVRTLLALPASNYQERYCYLSCKVSHELLLKLKRLRVLSLTGYSIEELSDWIGELKHLRYLNLSKTAIRLLPESVCTLLHLQILLLNQCTELAALPVEMSRLVNLLHLDISDTPNLQEMPPGLGNLTSLRVLPKFIIGKAGGGPTLRDLQGLSLLQGQLSISGLHNVVDVQDARIANLRQKHNLKELTLEWSNELQHCKNRSKANPMKVLESLHPHKGLQRLSISYYGASKFPSWVRNPSFLAEIVQLDLSGCINCESLPSLGRLPSLMSLNVKGMHAVTSLGPEFYGNNYIGSHHVVKAFPSLEFLRFEDMRKWEEWISPDDIGNVEVFPRLRELVLLGCPKLAGRLPSVIGSLVKLDVQMCPQLKNSPLSFPCLGELTMEDSSDGILRSMVDQSSITELKLKRISNLACLTEDLTKALVKLEVLEIEGCSELTCLWRRHGSESDENLPWLKSLVIKNCPQFESICGGLSSLKELRIESCQKFESFPETGLPCTLKRLTILDCRALESLPDTFGMNGLEELEIIGCSSLKSFAKHNSIPTVKRLKIENCSALHSLPDGIMGASGLEYLCFGDCFASESLLESGFSIPNLKILRISNCMNLRSLPNRMQNLTSLQELSLSNCVALTSIPEGCLPPNVTSLELRNCNKLKLAMSDWGLDKLHCLKEIKIVGPSPAATDMVSFPDDDEGLMLPSTLTSLSLESLQDLESLSRGFENLVVLEELHIKNCLKLRSLPKTGLPASLGRLGISGCPVLQDKCKKARGEYWPVIAHIPCLEIN